jgi:predicted cupin superfamily sugar epimerase
MARHPRAAALLESLALAPHPEGGFYREVYRDPAQVLHPTKATPRSAVTHIYFLLEEGTFSALHRVAQVELWHHVEGAPLELTQLSEAGALEVRLLQPGEVCAVPAFAWQAARPLGGFALCGCTVAPGFDFADFELPEREVLLARFPQHAEMVRELTRASSARART